MSNEIFYQKKSLYKAQGFPSWSSNDLPPVPVLTYRLNHIIHLKTRNEIYIDTNLLRAWGIQCLITSFHAAGSRPSERLEQWYQEENEDPEQRHPGLRMD